MTAKPSYEELERRVQELEKMESEHKYSREALQKNESLFKVLYEKAPLGYQSLDENGHFIVVNQTWLDTLGYTREEVIGKSFAEFLHPDWRDHFKENFPRFKSIGEVLGVEFEMVKKNGNLILVSFTGKISRDKNGDFQQTHCIFHDITERRRAEDKLRRYEWIIEKEMPLEDTSEPAYVSAYGDVTEFNRKRLILDGVKKETLEQMAADVMALLDTSLAVYEANGDYAYGIFKSSWCQSIDRAAFKLCDTNDVKKALACGKWLCHDNCWNDSANAAIRSGEPTDIECVGGIRLYAVPVFAGNEIVGAVNIGYGNPPTDNETLVKLSKKFNIGFDLLRAKANAYKPRPDFIIQLGKKRCRHMARMIGEIIERKQAEEALSKSEERFLLAMKASNDGLFDWNLETNDIYYSPAWKKMLGYEDHEIPNDFSIWETNTDPEDVKKSWDLQQKLVSKQIDRFVLEFKMKHKDGHWVDILSRAEAIFNEGGKAVRIVGTHVDITERKRLEIDRQKFFLLVESSSEFIGLCDLHMNPVYVNPAGQRMVGFPDMAAACRVKVQDYYFPEDQRFITEEFFPRVMREGHGDIEIRLRHFQTGEPIWMFYYLFSVQDAGGRPIGWATVSRNITERKQAEAEREKLHAQLLQSQKMESVGRLAGGVAHDFNNMLGVILGHAELALERVEENSDIGSDLKEIQKAAQRSADLTKQLLTFARKQIIEPKILHLNQTVKQMITMLQRLIGEDIDLLWKPAKHLWPVKMDPSQIDQILANLCVNARDAIAGVGKITIETGMVRFDEPYCAKYTGFIPGDFIMLGVSDDGCGMDKETLKNLFEPFFTTKEMGKGTGLGLAMVYGIVKQNKGFINVYSEPGQGSCFKIYLPRIFIEEASATGLPDKKTIAGGTETILLVEDEPAILSLARTMLERKGYSVLSAATPDEAIDMAGNHADKIHLLMTDVVMPGMNGRDLARQLTELYPDIKLLFMSGYTANVIAHQGVLDEGVAFIQKPFSMADLAEKVREVLDAAPN